MNALRLETAIKKFVCNKKQNPDHYQDSIAERKERLTFYQGFTPQRIRTMTEEDFYEYIRKLWSMMFWGNKQYIVDKLLRDNGLEKLKTQLIELLYGDKPIAVRWDTFLKEIKGMGASTISELLTYVNPTEYAIFNKTTVTCFQYLEIPDVPKFNYQYTGKKYVEVCTIAKEIARMLVKHGIEETDLLAVDYFLWGELLPMAEQSTGNRVDIEENSKQTQKASSFIHSELIEKLVTIGELLGFDSRSEVRIATGAIVDAVWEAKIGNMGKAIYVFEVQSAGSIDSLILNLRKAQSNAAVQAVVAVSDEKQIAKIKAESRGVIEEKSLRTWDSGDVLAVYNALTRAHESINNLALVPESFL